MSRDEYTDEELLRIAIREAVGEGAQVIADAIAGNHASDLWMEFVGPMDLCGLCGNYGAVYTCGTVFSPSGNECGVLRYCICPNGRTLKRGGADLKVIVDHIVTKRSPGNR